MFGLGGILDSKLFRGFQQSQLDSIYVTEMTVSIENNLKPIFTLNSKNSDKKLNFSRIHYLMDIILKDVKFQDQLPILDL